MKSSAMKAVTQVGVSDVSKDIGWRSFPVHEQILSSEDPAPFLARAERTCRQLNDIIQSGSGDQKERAQLAMTAYGRSLDLLRSLLAMREASAEQK